MNDVICSYSIDKILVSGLSLESLGIKNWALSRQKVLQVLEQFRELQVPILGGDVYRLVNGALRSNYDNWYCDELPNEFLSDFVIRSIDKAKQYIESYNIKKGDDIFFTLVPKV